MEHLGFRMGGAEREFVAVVVQRRSYPTATDYWDGNWLTSEVRLQMGGFSGRFEASLRAEEFVRFLTELKRLRESLHGQAVFATLEEQLRLELEGDGKGHIVVRGHARDEAGTGHQVKFRLQADQTMLQCVIADLQRVAVAYPVVSEGTA